eukprot:CFRG3143T1
MFRPAIKINELLSIQDEETVPFYIYDSPGFEWLKNLTVHPDWIRNKERIYRHKHGTERIFLDRAVSHPWRVLNPDEAKVFIVPFLLNYCPKKLRQPMMQAIEKALRTSPHFQKHLGRDHVIVASHYKLRTPNYFTPSMEKIMKYMTVAHGEVGSGKMPWRCTSVIPTVDKHPNQNEVPRDLLNLKFKERRYKYFFLGQIDARKAYTTRSRIGQEFLHSPLKDTTMVYSSSSTPDVSTFTDQTCTYAQCKKRRKCVKCLIDSHEYASIMAQSQFSLMIKGDTPISQRLYDSISFNTIPIIFSQKLWYEGLPFSSKVPWREFVLVVDENLHNVGQAMEDITNGYSTSEHTRRIRLWQIMRTTFPGRVTPAA